MHSNGHRDYDPRLGRYVESDPIGLDGGINTYAYAGNNPVNAVDPLGLRYHRYEGDPAALPDIDIEAQKYEQARSAPAELPPIDIAGQQRVVVAQAGPIGQFVVNAVRGAAAALGRGAAKTTEIVAQNGTKVTGITKHGIDRVVGDGAKRAGVKPEALLDAL